MNQHNSTVPIDTGYDQFVFIKNLKDIKDLRSLISLLIHHPFIRQVLFYCIVGFIATLTDTSTLFLLEKLGLHYIPASIFGFLVGLTTNYTLAKTFVFNTNKSNFSLLTEILFYSLIGVIGLLLTVGIMYFFTHVLGFYFMISKMLAIITVLVFNFTSRRFLLFK